jgi:hypothetical protein
MTDDVQSQIRVNDIQSATIFAPFVISRSGRTTSSIGRSSIAAATSPRWTLPICCLGNSEVLPQVPLICRSAE